MRQDASLLDGPFTACNSFKNSDSVLLCLVTFDINKVRRRFAVLGYQDGQTGFLKFRNESCGLTF